MVSDEKNTKLANKENLINQSLKEFKEKDEFMANLERLLTGSLLECELERFLMVLDLYQENPKILDPFLQSIVLPIIECLNVSLTVSGCIAKLGLFRLLYRLCKTIGYKSIQKFFTHDAEIMFPILVVLNGIPNSITQYWEIRYILVLWLSLAVMIPIDFKRLENSSQFKKLQLECNSNDGLRTLLLTQGKSLLSQAGVEFEAAALLCTRVISRTDSIEHLGEFVAGVIEDVRQSSDVFQTRGSLYCLCMLYKLVPSEELRKLNEHLLPFLSKVGVQGFKNIRLHQKLFIKLSQRVGKSLIIPDQEFSIDGIPEEIETIVSILLENLTGNDTVVRWSAAKGIGRICSRLPSDFVNQIVEEIVNLISEDSLSTGSVIEVSICSDKTWHGGVLAFSELARRCLLQAENLKLVIPWMNRALSFEIDKGTYSLGSNVRDSACYFFWSLARAYGSAELEQYANPIACSLVATALLDREVGVRRAASAAFQENAGRHNIYPNRLEIIALADYFAVGSRVGCYTEIVVEVCKFDSYRHELLENLKFRVTHWNESIRELSSKSLGLIASEYPEEVISILEFIVICFNSFQFRLRAAQKHMEF